jgi:NarL family two-component system response regulator LiaR
MSDSRPIRVLLVDDNAVVRSGLSAFLTAITDLELAGEASSGERAISLCKEVQPDVVLMDLVMPGMGGANATRKIREQYPHIQVIALTSFKDQDLVQGALQAGAIGYLLKEITAAELAAAIRAAYAGKPTLAPEAQQVLIDGTRSPANKPGFDLTKKELEVLVLMVEGYNNIQIAERLVLSVSETKIHVNSILSKLHTGSRTEAVAIALQNHLVR